MSWQAWFTLAVALLSLLCLARDWLAPSNVMVGAAIVLLLADVISPTEAFAGFGNTAPITVAALYVLARAAEKTGLLQPMVERLLGRGGRGRWAMARLLVPPAAASAFLNNTPIVAMLIPQVLRWCERPDESRDCLRLVHQRQNSRAARKQHLQQARPAVSLGRDRIRLRTSAPLTRESSGPHLGSPESRT